MNMPSLASLLAGLDFLALCAAQARPSTTLLKPDDDPKVIIAKVLKVYGGEHGQSRWNCGYLKYKTKGGIIPSFMGEVILEDTFQLPGYFKRVTRMQMAGQQMNMIFVVNHGKCWTKTDNEPAREEPGQNNFTSKSEHPFARMCDAALLSHLAGSGATLSKLSADKINGHDVIAIRAKSEALRETDDFLFDSETGFLRKTMIARPGPHRDSVTECLFDDYKSVQGSPVPMRIKETQDGKTLLDVRLIEVKFEKQLDEGIFAKP
jgi:hypothetical protein